MARLDDLQRVEKAIVRIGRIGASREAARNRAEQLRREAKELRVEDDGQSYAGITLSMGVALYPLHGRTIENALRAADSALYRAKQEGRDQVVVAEIAH